MYGLNTNQAEFTNKPDGFRDDWMASRSRIFGSHVSARLYTEGEIMDGTWVVW